MTPGALAALHAEAFPGRRIWDAGEFASLLAQPATLICTARNSGFALGRVIASEAELITLAVAPAAQRKGLGRSLLQAFEDGARTRNAGRAFLEVAEDNMAALALYRAAGWRESARRPGYYRRRGTPARDALLFEKTLT